MLGACSGLPASNSITVNEVTTIGSVWPLAAFMTSSSAIGSAPNDTSFLNAVASVPEFINLAQGSSPGKPASTSYFAENSKLYSLSDLLANCVNSTGGSAGDSSPCGLLFSMATPPGGTAPTDTMAAAMRIAQNPSNNVTEIFGLAKAETYFSPTLTAAPNDWTLALTYLVAAPSISLATGTYVGAQEVEISDSTAGSIIHYTTDGTVPTSSSPIYSGALSISVSSTVQAIAMVGESQSSVASSTLTITAAAQAAAKLAFLQQPSNALTGAPITPAVTVAIEDAAGNMLPSATNLCRSTLTAVPRSAERCRRRTERHRYLQQPHRWHPWKRVHVDRNEPRPNLSDKHDIRNRCAHNRCAVGRYRNTGQRHTDAFADTNVHSHCRGNVEHSCDLGADPRGGHDLSGRPLYRSCDGTIP